MTVSIYIYYLKILVYPGGKEYKWKNQKIIPQASPVFGTDITST